MRLLVIGERRIFKAKKILQSGEGYMKFKSLINKIGSKDVLNKMVRGVDRV